MKEGPPAVEGYVEHQGYRTWYRVVGDGEDRGALPLLCLHGGPGAPHDYLEPLEEMALTGRRVVFYDQLGCGNSDKPSDPSMWTVGLFLVELAAVRRELGLGRVHILGQSWGGMLALEYALTRPEGLKSVVLASSPASVPQWISEAYRLRSELPEDTLRVLEEHEEAGTTSDPAYEEAMFTYYRRHVCRMDPWPGYVVRTFEKAGQHPEVYNTMWGPSEFVANGTLEEWDLTSRLGEIEVPALITSGKYDEMTPLMARTVKEGIPGSRWVLFERSAHMSHAEEKKRYLEVLARFLASVEAR